MMIRNNYNDTDKYSREGMENRMICNKENEINSKHIQTSEQNLKTSTELEYNTNNIDKHNKEDLKDWNENIQTNLDINYIINDNNKESSYLIDTLGKVSNNNSNNSSNDMIFEIKKKEIKYNNDDRLATSIPFIMHTADQMAAIYENKRWETDMNPVKSTRKPSTGRPAKGNLTETFANNDVKPTSVFDAFKGIIED